MLGNFPQGLTHLSHIAAAVALEQSRRYEIPIASEATEKSRRF